MLAMDEEPLELFASGCRSNYMYFQFLGWPSAIHSIACASRRLLVASVFASVIHSRSEPEPYACSSPAATSTDWPPTRTRVIAAPSLSIEMWIRLGRFMATP